MRLASFSRLVTAAVLVAACSAAPVPDPTSSPAATSSPRPTAGFAPRIAPTAVDPTDAQLIGQKLMVAMAGTTPSAALLGRIERGEVGGVILFGANIRSAPQVAALTRTLRAAAAAGGQPPLLVATDQEGGSIRRVPWAPPTISVPRMGADGRASVARAQGMATAVTLGCAGIDTDLAPVADVPSSTTSFMYAQGRTWSFDPDVTATLSTAFADGVRDGLGVPAMKHFPGVGRAARNTDLAVVAITASTSALASDLRPYRTAIAAGIPMVMLSNAVYTAYDPSNAAGWSRAIGVDLLRGTLGFRGVSITDSLDGAAAARGVSTTSLALRAARAGTDMILLTGAESTSASTYAALATALRDGSLSRTPLRASYERIAALKASLVLPAPDSTAPAVAGPVSRFAVPATLGSGTAVVRTSWSASDPCTIATQVLRRSTNGGGWVTQAVEGPASRSVSSSLSLDATYRHALRATDGAGNTSPWAYGLAVRPVLTEQANYGVTLSGAWRTTASRSVSGGSLVSSSSAGASATFAFTGAGVGWVAYRGPDRGAAAVYVDGTYRTTIDLHSSNAQPRRVVFSAGWPAIGSHAIRIVNVGTAGRPRIDVDAFLSLGAP